MVTREALALRRWSRVTPDESLGWNETTSITRLSTGLITEIDFVTKFS